MVAARGITSVFSFALDEAQLRKATLCVLYVKEIAVYSTPAGRRCVADRNGRKILKPTPSCP